MTFKVGDFADITISVEIRGIDDQEQIALVHGEGRNPFWVRLDRLRPVDWEEGEDDEA